MRKIKITIKIHKSNILHLEPFASRITWLCHNAKSKADYIKLRFTFENTYISGADESYMICKKIELLEVTSDSSRASLNNFIIVKNFCHQHHEAVKRGALVRPEVKLLKCHTINDLPDTYKLINDSQDVAAVFDSIGRKKPDDIDGLFVLCGNGEYDSIYGFAGGVPALSKPVKKVI